MIVDMTMGYEIYSLMDGFSKYNQIKIAPEDQEKTVFTCALVPIVRTLFLLD